MGERVRPGDGEPPIDFEEIERGRASTERADFYGAIVEVATARASGETSATPLPCPLGSEGDGCAGRMVVLRQDIPAEIRWRCPECGEAGTLTGWRGSLRDFTARSPGRSDPDVTGESAGVLLSEDQWRFIRTYVVTMDPEVERMLAAAELVDEGVLVHGPEEDFEELAGHVAFEANHTVDPGRRRVCEEILDRLDEVLLEGGTPLDLAPLALALEEGTANYNRTPQPELGGLSPEQAHRLLVDDWETPGGAVELDETSSPEMLGKAPLLTDARRFLDTLAKEDGTRATNAGNLNRAFVDRMFRSMRGVEADLRETILVTSKHVNEQDVWPLHLLRVLLDVAGLIKRRKGAFTTTKRGDRLRAEERAGELYARLFVTHFRKLNLAYVDARGPELGGFQQTIAYAFYRFAEVGSEWRKPSELVDEVVLPAVRREIPRSKWFDLPASIVKSRFLEPLVGFGLAERGSPEREEGPPGLVIERPRYRKSSLYDRFLRFDVGE